MKSEIVIGFVGPVGVNNRHFHCIAEQRLQAFGYKSELIRVSGLIKKFASIGFPETGLKFESEFESEFERIKTYMEAGDDIRKKAEECGSPNGRGVLALSVATTIGRLRKPDPKDSNRTLPKPGFAWLVSSLKNPAEVDILRGIYREGFFLIGIYASEMKRERNLRRRGMTADNAKDLIKLDTKSASKFGQQTQKTFELADAWVETEEQFVRVLDLIFGDCLQTPEDDESAMALAYSEALRSSDLSRQVGAVIVSKNGDVLSVGRNEVPAPGGGQYGPPDSPMARDCDLGEDFNHKERSQIQDDLLEDIGARIKKHLTDEEHVGKIMEEVSNSLGESRIHDITEYGRAVHAEMAAITAAVRVGVSVRGGTLYCTTFPCHNCAKHIVASGIKRVVFVEPYPKSKARVLHADSIELADEEVSESERKMAEATEDIADKRTSFHPFIGVGPRRYFDLFSMNLGAGDVRKRKDGKGKKRAFEPENATPRVPLSYRSYLIKEIDSAIKFMSCFDKIAEVRNDAEEYIQLVRNFAKKNADFPE